MKTEPVRESGQIHLISIWLICFCIAVTLLVPRITHRPSPANAGSNRHEPNLIHPGTSIRDTLTAMESETFRIPFVAGQFLRLSIDKGDFAVAATLYDPSGTKLLEHTSRDYEPLEISSRIHVSGTYTLELHSLESTTTRSYDLTLQSLTSATAADDMDSEARQLIANAESLRAIWTEESLNKAAREYENAAQIWISGGDLTNASRAVLRSGDLNFLLNRYDYALSQFQKAFSLAGRKRDRVGQALALSRIARLHSYRGDNDSAQKELTTALQLFKHVEAGPAVTRHAYGEILSVFGEVVYAKGNLKKASTHFEHAKNFFEGDRKATARIHLFAGYIAGSIGNGEKAFAEISQALELFRAVNDQSGEALALTALGLSYSLRGDDTNAIALHREAAEISRSIGDRHSRAIAQNGLGQAYENLREYSIALNNYENALRLFESIGSLDGQSVINCNIGRTKYLSGNLNEALKDYTRCLSLSRAAKKSRTEAYALNEIAKVYVSRGDDGLTLKQYQRLEHFYHDIDDHRGLAKALNTKGDFLFNIGQKQRALQAYDRALNLSEEVGEQEILISTLYNLARIYLDLGFPETALPFVQRSLKIIENQRTNVMSSDLRVSYFSAAQKHAELCIQILMQLDRLHPRKGYAIEALSVSENGRARSLLDLVTESRSVLRNGVTDELLARERDLRAMLRAQIEYRMNLFDRGDSLEIAEVDHEITAQRAEYQEIQARLRKWTSRVPGTNRPQSFDLTQLHTELQESNALLLEYALGDEHSYLWAVTANSVNAYELPGRKIVEASARELHELLSARQRIDVEMPANYQSQIEAADTLLREAENKLSEMVLAPVAEQLGTKRLLVITEGALQYVPFDVLPVPYSGKRLLETTEVVVLPSFLTLMGLRQAAKQASSPTKVVAVLADPVFSRNDSRLLNQEFSSPLPIAATGNNSGKFPQILTRGDGLARLTYASEEADAIVAVAPWGTALVATGFDAKRERAMSDEVAQYQILHFATHGFVNTEHPEPSGMVFSMIDRTGARTDGLLPLRDIYSLDLSAELTVLSGCQTALGKDMKGEGLVGLTHSFMAAGSKSVVATLWKVDDRATAFLMTEFYTAMLQKGMPPSAALRFAKLKMMHDKRWSAPYFWAGFILQGEYRNRIVVENNSWTQIAMIVFVLVVLLSRLTFHKRKSKSLKLAQRT